MFDLEKRERSVLLILIAILLIGIAFGFYQRRPAYVGVRSDSFVWSERNPSAENLKININEADIAKLMKLKGVGKVLAGRIIEYRSANGNFRSVEELRKVKGLGQKLYEKIKDEVSID